MRKIVVVMLTICSMLCSNLTVFASGKGEVTYLTAPHSYSQEEAEKKVQENQNNIIYEEIFTVMIETTTREVIPAEVKFRVYYDSSGLSFSTEVIADGLVFLKTISGKYQWEGGGNQESYPYRTTAIVPAANITNYENTGFHYSSGTQLICHTIGGATVVTGGGCTFTKTALVTIP